MEWEVRALKIVARVDILIGELHAWNERYGRLFGAGDATNMMQEAGYPSQSGEQDTWREEIEELRLSYVEDEIPWLSYRVNVRRMLLLATLSRAESQEHGTDIRNQE